ncbi:MAG: alpha-L-fucosidase [Pelagimonas sp.]
MTNTLRDFRYRQIHLDFHTSEAIAKVGAQFDPEQFAATLKDGCVDSVTLFARCHHGWCYYPTDVAESHPGLERPDLLGDMIKACHAEDIATPIYITVQWDELTARKHPEWRVMSAYNSTPHYPGQEPSTMSQLTATWHTLCLNNQGYVDYLTAMSREVVERYDPPGLFMDILGSHECVCPTCLASMTDMGFDPAVSKDRQAHDRVVLLRFFEEFSAAMHEVSPDLRVFYNSGHIFKGERDRYSAYGHLELESLPTGGWGYDHFPTSARYADTLGYDFLGMTGKFHTHWGEFGGFKRPEALIYECCHMVALGARCSIGDQLHPNGIMSAATYDTIRPAYARVKSLEPYLKGAVYQREIAILSVESTGLAGDWDAGRNHECDDAAARMLLELQMPFDVIDSEADFGDYRLLVLPDELRVDEVLAEKLRGYQAAGGAVIASGESGLLVGEERFALDLGVTHQGGLVGRDPSYIRVQPGLHDAVHGEPIVVYDRAQSVTVSEGAEVLAECQPSYFDRRWDHFCSHLHAPHNPGAEALGAAIVQKDRAIYVSYKLFNAYLRLGQPIYKYIFAGLIKRLIGEGLVTTSLPSAGRVSLTRQVEEGRDILHLLYAPTQVRGKGISDPDGVMRPIEIIEDVPELRDVEVSVKLDSAPTAVRGFEGQEVSWSYDNDRLSLTLPKLYIHEAVVIERG